MTVYGLPREGTVVVVVVVVVKVLVEGSASEDSGMTGKGSVSELLSPSLSRRASGRHEAIVYGCRTN